MRASRLLTILMLLQTRGPKGMAEHRLLRLGVPFAVFWLPIATLTMSFATIFVHRMLRGTWGFDVSIVNPPPGVPR